LVGLNAETGFLREAATAGNNVHTMFGGENHFKLKCALTEKREWAGSFCTLATWDFYKGYLSIRYAIRSDV
jgi:hypothetical protein